MPSSFHMDKRDNVFKFVGKDAPLSELVDFISAAHLSKEADAGLDMLSFESALGSRSQFLVCKFIKYYTSIHHMLFA